MKVGRWGSVCMRVWCACVCVLRVVHILGPREGLQGPVEVAVEEDEAGTGRPHHQDSDEGHAQVIDHLRKQQHCQQQA